MHAREVHHRNSWPDTLPEKESEEVSTITTREMARIAAAAYPTEPHDMSELLAQDALFRDRQDPKVGPDDHHSEDNSSSGVETPKATHLKVHYDSADRSFLSNSTPNTDTIGLPGFTETTSIALPSTEKVLERQNALDQEADDDGSLDEATEPLYEPRSTQEAFQDVREGANTGANATIRGLRPGVPRDTETGPTVIPDAPARSTEAVSEATDETTIEELFQAEPAEIEEPARIVKSPEEQETVEQSADLASEPITEVVVPTKPEVALPEGHGLTRRQYRALAEKIRDEGGDINDLIAQLREDEANEQPVAQDVELPVEPKELDSDETPSIPSKSEELEGTHELGELFNPLRVRAGEVYWQGQYQGEEPETWREKAMRKLWKAGHRVKEGLLDMVYYGVAKEGMSDGELTRKMDKRRKVVMAASAVIGVALLARNGVDLLTHAASAADPTAHIPNSGLGLGEHNSWTQHSGDMPKVTITSEIDPSQVVTHHYEPVKIGKGEGMIEAILRANPTMSDEQANDLWRAHGQEFIAGNVGEGQVFYQEVPEDPMTVGINNAGELPDDLQEKFNELFRP